MSEQNAAFLVITERAQVSREEAEKAFRFFDRGRDGSIERQKGPKFSVVVSDLHPFFWAGLDDERLVVRRAKVNPLRNFLDCGVWQLRILGGHVRFLEMGDKPDEEAFRCFAGNDDDAFVTALEQARTCGEIQPAACFVAAVAFHAMLLEHGAHVALEERQPTGHFRRVFF
jgi:hypothetical protein